jgi:hypothetical protein
MNGPRAATAPQCGQCPDSFTNSIAVFVLDALAPTLEQTPLTEAEGFDPLLLDTAVRACSGLITGPSVEPLAVKVHCVASAHLSRYVPAPETDRSPSPAGCTRPQPSAIYQLGRLLVADPERGLALLRRAADDYYER